MSLQRRHARAREITRRVVVSRSNHTQIFPPTAPWLALVPWCPCCTTAQVARMVRRLDGRRRLRDAPLFAGHEYAIPATGTVKYDCCSATGEP